MRYGVLLLAAFSIAPAAAAQLVHPNQYVANEGAFNNSIPFNYSTGAGHYQQSYDKTQFPGLFTITEIAYRYKGDSSYSSGQVDLKVTLAYCATPWNAVTSNYAGNIGANATVVHDGVWAFDAFSGDAATPNPFTARLKLTTPFTFDPSLGDLLMDLEIRSSATASSGGAFSRADNDVGVYRVYSNDGNPTGTSGTVGKSGLITEFTGGPILTYGEGCPGAGGFTPELSLGGLPEVGQQVAMSLGNGVGGALSLTMISAGEASVPIGGGCTLLVQLPVLGIFIPLGGVGPGAGSYTLPGVIPLTSPLGPVFFQAFVADATSQTGFSATNGVSAQIY